MKKEKDEELFAKELLGSVCEKAEKPFDEEGFFGEEVLEHEEGPFEHQEEKLEHEENGAEREALFAFAKAMGKDPKDVLEILRKGEEFDEISEKLGRAKGDTEVFEKLAEIRGISKEEMKNEILWAIEKATLEKMIGEIQKANPGMNRETAKELALFRLEAKRTPQEEPEKDMNEAMLSELEKFVSKHSGEGIEKLANSVVEEWEGGIPLEAAFEKYRLFAENEKLIEEIEKMKNEKMIEAQKNYAKEHSPGSATSAAGSAKFDEFVAGLFREY